LQDVDAYIEDLHDTVFYTELFKSVAPKNVRIARVFEAGNRGAVVAAALSHDFSKRRAFFMIDGDFEWVRDEPPPAPSVVHRLDAYCIENLLVQEKGGVQVVVEETVVSAADASALLSFESWLRGISGSLLELFVVFAALNLAVPTEPTVGLGIGKILKSSKKGAFPTLDPQKIIQLTADVKRKTREVLSDEEASALEQKIRDRANSLSNSTDIISGKDFLLPLFEFHLWHCMGAKTRRNSLRFRLARHCDLSRFQAITDALSAC